MNTLQNLSEWAVQMGKNVISIIPTIRTFLYIFVPIRNCRFSSDSYFFVLFRTCSCTNGRQSLVVGSSHRAHSTGLGYHPRDDPLYRTTNITIRQCTTIRCHMGVKHVAGALGISMSKGICAQVGL